MNEIEIERQLKVLANRRRLSILNLLRKRKEADVTAISEVIRLSFTSTSKHLTMLERAGFVEKEQRSLNVFYRLSKDAPKITRSILAMF
ncbi:MAG: metalloregulator ArsR/SmtB family transcription factor [Patescibacteria group bacterium]|nr:metalloregulator ArsR/SmtB family transcription factor [Patescibacteria group bacterium]